MYYYLPVIDHLLKPENILPISREVFAPLNGIPMFRRINDAFFAGLFAFSRQASSYSDNETLPTPSPCSDQSDPKILILGVKVDPFLEAGFAMPDQGADYNSCDGWASILCYPFHRAAATNLHKSRIECLQEGRTISVPCEVFWARVKMGFVLFTSEKVSVLLSVEED